MEGFLVNVTSPSWWLSVLVTSVVAIVLARYLMPRLESVGSRFSSRIQALTEKSKRERENRIEWLRQDKHEQLLISHSITRNYIVGATLIIMGNNLLTLSVVIISVVSGLGTLVMIMGFTYLFDGKSSRTMLEEARKERKPTQSAPDTASVTEA